MNEIAYFAKKGTGANIDIFCGFVPAKIIVYNITDANITSLTWLRGMADASAIKNGAARSIITTLGITPLGADGGATATGARGFRIGADATVNVLNNDLVIEAVRGGEGNQF